MAKHSMDDGASVYCGGGVKAERIAISESLPPSKDDQERERVRRSLIYADMVSTLGRIDYRRLASWPYQPTEDEVQAIIDAAKAHHKAANGRTYAKRRAESA